MLRPRWEGDERGIGIGTGESQRPAVRALLAALGEPGWIAEDPDHHLLPHLRAACAEPKSPWTLGSASLGGDGVYRVDLTWEQSNGSLRQLRADVFALVGRIAEATTHVRQCAGEGTIEFQVVTGMLDGDSAFAGHGHLLLLRVTGQHIPGFIAGMRRTPPAAG
jgi:hypothetical protein